MERGGLRLELGQTPLLIQVMVLIGFPHQEAPAFFHLELEWDLGVLATRLTLRAI